MNKNVWEQDLFAPAAEMDEPRADIGIQDKPAALQVYLTSEEVHKKRNFTESNKAAFMHNDWTISEWRLFILIVSRLNSIELEGIEEGSNRPVEIYIPFSDLYNKLGIRRQNARAMLEAAMSGLHTKTITFLKRDEDGNFICDTKEQYNFISSSRIKSEYNKRTGKEFIHLVVRLNGDLNYLFLNLRKNFVSVDSDLLLQFKYPATIKMYLMFVIAASQTNGMVNRTYKLPHLRLLAFGDDKKYPQYGNFKSHVIQTAVNEINTKTEMQVSYKEEKESRSKAVSSVTFTFGFPPKEKPEEHEWGSKKLSWTKAEGEAERKKQLKDVQQTMMDKDLVAACLKQRLNQKQIATFASLYGYKNFRYLVWLSRVFDSKTFYKNLSDKETAWSIIKDAKGNTEVVFD